MKRLYDDNLYRFDTPQPSYWEATAGDIAVHAAPLHAQESCDIAIIGGGYTGLTAAWWLAKRYGADVRVLEAGHIGWGASGRNGGFCCMGGTALHRGGLLRKFGAEVTRAYYQTQADAVRLVRDIAQEESLDIDLQGDAELEVAHSRKAFNGMRQDVDVVTRLLGLEAELIDADAFRERFYDSPEQHGALRSGPAFGMHPLKFCRGLAAAAVRHGAVLHANSEVLEWQKCDDGRHRLVTAGGSLSAKRVVFATNAFMPEHLRPEFAARILPVVSAIIVTRPLAQAELDAHRWITDDPAINSRRLLNYFRVLPDRRVMIGGRGHSRGDPEGERRTYGTIERAMWRMWPAWRDVDVEYRWHGLICFTRSLRPSIGRLEGDGSVYYGYGYHGNGVNNATWTGKQLADWIGSGDEPALTPVVRGIGGRFPLPGQRLRYLRAGIALSGWLDRLG